MKHWAVDTVTIEIPIGYRGRMMVLINDHLSRNPGWEPIRWEFDRSTADDSIDGHIILYIKREVGVHAPTAKRNPNRVL